MVWEQHFLHLTSCVLQAKEQAQQQEELEKKRKKDVRPSAPPTHATTHMPTRSPCAVARSMQWCDLLVGQDVNFYEEAYP